MEEKNELNDIILNKSGSGSSTKKLLLAIAALTLILIIVLVIMNSLKTQSDEQAPHAAVPPEPSSPTEVIDDPLFEPVEVIQEGGNTSASADLGEIAQKIKQESFQSTPAAQPAPEPAVEQIKPMVQSASDAVSVPKAEPKPAPKPVATQPKPIVTSPKPVVTAPKAETAPKAAQPVVNTPTIKKSAPVEPKKAVVTAPKTSEKPVEKAAAKPAVKAADTEGTYYIQVGSFTKQPNQALFDRLNASGLKYITAPSGEKTKVLVGPFQGEKAARDVLGTVKRNIESGAYITKG